jgi:hypothetical protein
MIAAEFQLTSDDYAEAQVAHLTTVLGRRFVLGICVLGLGLAVTLIIALTDGARIHELLPSWIFFGAMFLLLFVLRSKVLYRMRFNRTKALHESIHFEAGDDGVVFRTKRGESTTKWEGVEKWWESKGIFLLYLQPRLFFVVPKRVLDIKQVVAFRALLMSRVQ